MSTQDTAFLAVERGFTRLAVPSSCPSCVLLGSCLALPTAFEFPVVVLVMIMVIDVVWLNDRHGDFCATHQGHQPLRDSLDFFMFGHHVCGGSPACLVLSSTCFKSDVEVLCLSLLSPVTVATER